MSLRVGVGARMKRLPTNSAKMWGMSLCQGVQGGAERVLLVCFV